MITVKKCTNHENVLMFEKRLFFNIKAAGIHSNQSVASQGGAMRVTDSEGYVSLRAPATRDGSKRPSRCVSIQHLQISILCYRGYAERRQKHV